MRKIPAPYTDPAPLFRHGGALPKDRSDLLDFSASINPLGPPESVLRVLRDELPNIAHYPDPECRQLTEHLAALHCLAPSSIVVGNGSNELIYAIVRAIRPRRVAIVEPTYTEYLRASLLVGAKVDHWLAKSGFRRFDPGRAKVVWICHPNNPTGNMWASASELARWVEAHPRTLFVVDEAFLTESDIRWFPRTLIPYIADRLPNLIVLRSLTKSYALPGLRLGYAVTQPELAERLRAQVVPWSVNSLAQCAGLAALRDRDYERRTAEWLKASRAPFAEGLQNLMPHLRPLTSRANFFLLRLKTMTSDRLTARLAERGIAIRDAANFVGLDRRYVRIAIRTPTENARLLEEIEVILAKEASTCRAR